MTDLNAVRKTKFVRDFVAGDAFDCVFRLDSLAAKKTSRGSDYWVLTLRDKTGTVDAKLWELHREDQLPRPGDFARVRCTVGEYRGDVDVKVTRIRSLDPATETVAVEDFVPVGPNDRFEQIKLVAGFVHVMRHPGLKAICEALLTDARQHQALRDAPAAHMVHHAYVGGLVDHILSMMKIAEQLTTHYDLGDDVCDLLHAACLFHDVGKTRELAWSVVLDTTVEGRLVGHVGIGLQIVDLFRPVYWTAIEEAKLELGPARIVWDHLQHLIASHHGNLEWGAVKRPQSREAVLFHLIDLIDSKMALFDRVHAEELFNQDGFSSWIKHLDGVVWKP